MRLSRGSGPDHTPASRLTGLADHDGGQFRDTKPAIESAIVGISGMARSRSRVNVEVYLNILCGPVQYRSQNIKVANRLQQGARLFLAFTVQHLS
jgi:hypothetical protein